MFVHQTLRKGRLYRRRVIAMTTKLKVETSFVNLTPAGQQAYEEIRTRIGALLAQPNGLDLVLNALVAQGPETTLTDISIWVEGVEDIDSRDLVGFCHGPGRIITVESTIVDS